MDLSITIYDNHASLLIYPKGNYDIESDLLDTKDVRFCFINKSSLVKKIQDIILNYNIEKIIIKDSDN